MKPDLLFSTKLDANIISAAATYSLGEQAPRLVVRETNSHIARGDIGTLRSKAIGLAYRSSDRVVALSEGIRTELVDLYKLAPSQVVTIHNPVAIPNLVVAAQRAANEPSPVGRNHRLVVAVGRLTRQKGFDILLHAFAHTSLANTILAILGEGEERQELQALTATLGLENRVILPGFVSNPGKWLAHADLFVLSSRWEGFGHVIVEAMAAGVPVVAFDCPHGPRDIIENNVTGVLVPTNDEVELGLRIAQVLSNSAMGAQLSAAARKKLHRFSLTEISKTYVQLFREIVYQDAAIGRVENC